MRRPRLAAALFALLTANTAYYVFFAGRASQVLDALAWYTLLILLAVEALRDRGGGHGLPPGALRLIHALRLVAALFIAAGALLYVRERAWLDVANIVLWLLVVLVLELEVRCPALAARRRRLLSAVARMLYAALGFVALLWLARGAWMDAWDAAVWLAAFALLERQLDEAAVSQPASRA